jgi:hypothetical protein
VVKFHLVCEAFEKPLGFSGFETENFAAFERAAERGKERFGQRRRKKQRSRLYSFGERRKDDQRERVMLVLAPNPIAASGLDFLEIFLDVFQS